MTARARVGILIAAAAVATGCAGDAPPRAISPASLVIVLCDCPTQPDRKAFANALARRGIAVRSSYENIGGVIVEIPAHTNVEQFTARLRRLPGVVSVIPNSADRPSRP